MYMGFYKVDLIHFRAQRKSEKKNHYITFPKLS